MKIAIYCFLFFFLLSVSIVFADQWSLETEIDSMTDEIKKTAIVVNSTDHCLALYKLHNGIWLNFNLPQNNGDMLADDLWPIYRVDKNKPLNLQDFCAHDKQVQLFMQKERIVCFEYEPKYINWEIHHGPIKSFHDIDEKLKELMNGDKIVFRYFLLAGGHKETTFSLIGARDVILRMIGINDSER